MTATSNNVDAMAATSNNVDAMTATSNNVDAPSPSLLIIKFNTENASMYAP